MRLASVQLAYFLDQLHGVVFDGLNPKKKGKNRLKESFICSSVRHGVHRGQRYGDTGVLPGSQRAGHRSDRIHGQSTGGEAAAVVPAH